ncbi:MAG: hydrogenase 3 maturation endopeptidase HyCI [bacterium]
MDALTRRAVLAVGNRQRGDDAVGPLIADQLESAPGLLVLDAGLSPENYLGPLTRFRPNALLIIDACDFGGEPGEHRLCGRAELERLAGGSVSTHTLPLSLTVTMLEMELEVRIDFLGIQPASLELAERLSGPVAAALPGLVELVRDWAAGRG